MAFGLARKKGVIPDKHRGSRVSLLLVYHLFIVERDYMAALDVNLHFLPSRTSLLGFSKSRLAS